MYPDQEINALNSVYGLLKELNPAQIQRIVEWLTSKYHLDEQEVTMISPEVALSSTPAALAEAELPAREEPAPPVKKRRGRPPRKATPAAEVSPSQTEILPGSEGFMKFDTFEDLFFSSNAKTVAATILLAAAYLQEKQRLDALNTSAINSQMQKVGQQVQNISASINSLLTRTPALLIQTGKLGDSKQARRQYKVTEEGLRIARNYINE